MAWNGETSCTAQWRKDRSSKLLISGSDHHRRPIEQCILLVQMDQAHPQNEIPS